jgi:hypothetical protein
MEDTKLTTVKIITDWYKQFKYHAITDEFTLQKLVNRSIYKYVNDDEYRQEILNYELPLSGSKF